MDPARVLPAAVAATASHPELELRVTLAPAISDRFRIVSSTALVPGRANPKEVLIAIENVSGEAGTVLIEGSWTNTAGDNLGGVSTELAIAAHAVADFLAGTRATDATLFAAGILPVAEAALPVEDQALLDAAASGVQGYGVAFTPTPRLGDVPPWTPRGLANGAVFHGRTVLFTPDQGQWRMEIHDREFDPGQGTALARADNPGLQTIFVTLPTAPIAGAVYQKPMSYGGAYFQIKPAPGSDETTSWNSEVAWAIAIDEWYAAPWQPGGETFQRAGSASGRIYICFKGAAGKIENSFLAGEFIDAPVVYYGPPE